VPTRAGLVHVCYVCRAFIVAGHPTCDKLTVADEDTFPADVSHGVCSTCEPLEWARILAESDALALTTWAARQWQLSREAARRRAAVKFPTL
jgi:hypothetical protein